MNDDTIQLLTQGAFLLVFVLTLIDLFRYRDRQRLEVAGLFATLGISIAIGLFTRATAIEMPLVAKVGTLGIVAQPYLLLRLVEHFRPLPRVQHALGLAGLLVSWLVILIAETPLPRWATLAVVVAFGYVEAYATLAFIRAAVTASGVTKRRLVAIALGSGLLAAVILLAGLSAALPVAAPFMTPISRLGALAAAIAYYLGFAPPRWLRGTWQMAELQRFLAGLVARPAEERLTAALQHLGPASARAIGGKAAVVAVQSDESRELTIQADAENRAVLEAAGITRVSRGLDSAVIMQAWDQQRAVAADDEGEWGSELRRLAEAFGGARAALMAPLATGGQPHGLVIVLFERRPLFPDDELALLTMLANQAAVALEVGELYSQAQREAAQRQVLLDLSQAIAAASDARAVAEQVVDHLARLLPAATCSVLLRVPDGGLEVAAVRGTLAHLHPGRRFPAGSGVAARALQSGAPVVVDDVRVNPDWPGLDPDVRSTLAAPLRHHDESLGVLTVQSGLPAAFGSEEVAMAQIVAAHVAVALARAQLVEQLLQQNVALEEAVQELEAFSYSVSHDLRAPLRAMDGFSRILAEEHGANLSSEAQRYLRLVRDNAQQMGHLVDDLLAFSRLSRQPLTREWVDPARVARQALAERRDELEGRRLKISIGELPACWADPALLKQVVANLLGNALKFTRGREAAEIQVGCSQDGDGSVYFVRDNGAGFDMRYADKLFGVFQRLHRAEEYEGTGVGLAIVQRIVHRHGGRVWAEGEVGRGATFSFTIGGDGAGGGR